MMLQAILRSNCCICRIAILFRKDILNRLLRTIQSAYQSFNKRLSNAYTTSFRLPVMSHVTQVTLVSSVTLIILSTLLFSHVDPTTKAGILFLSLFYFRYIKLIVNTASWLLAKPYPYSPNPKYHPEDVTVIIPTANPGNTEFRGTVKSALLSGASKVIVVTFGEENMDTAQDVCEGLPHFDKL